MSEEKRHVGRPTNEEVKQRRTKKVLAIVLPLILVVFLISFALVKTDVIKLKGLTYTKEQADLNLSKIVTKDAKKGCKVTYVGFSDVGGAVKKVEIINKSYNNYHFAFIAINRSTKFLGKLNGSFYLKKGENKVNVLTYDSGTGSDVLMTKSYIVNIGETCKDMRISKKATKYTPLVNTKNATTKVSTTVKGAKYTNSQSKATLKEITAKYNTSGKDCKAVKIKFSDIGTAVKKIEIKNQSYHTFSDAFFNNSVNAEFSPLDFHLKRGATNNIIVLNYSAKLGFPVLLKKYYVATVDNKCNVSLCLKKDEYTTLGGGGTYQRNSCTVNSKK